MHGSAQYSVNTYAQVGIETAVASASPHKLILFLFNGAIEAVAAGKRHMGRGDIAAKGESLSKAIAIIGELNNSLNHEAGGEISTNLEALYDYFMRRLLEANLNNRSDILDEVTGRLSELRDAWASIGPEETIAQQPTGD